jgi:riboflavin kinase/FMN adenylyltransferase
VEEGKHLARQWGIPTANLSFPKEFVSLRHGVYATRIYTEDRVYPAISNVGLRPTVEDSRKANCESYLFGYHGDLYGKTIACEFLQFIRPEQRFGSPEELKHQIDLDIREVEQYFEHKK